MTILLKHFLFYGKGALKISPITLLMQLFLLIRNKINNNNDCGRYFINLNFGLGHETDAIKNCRT